MRINNNMMAMNTHRQLGIGNANGSKSMEKLSSGFRINRAGDDAAGLSISEKMRGQIRGLTQASRNAQDGISLIQTAEGALNESQAILQRMRELAVQSSNDTNVGIDREAIQGEIDQLKSEIDRIGNTTEFNTQSLLKGDGKTNLTATGLDLSAITTKTAGTDATSKEVKMTVNLATTSAAADTVKVGINGKEFTFTLGNAGGTAKAGDVSALTSNSATIDIGGATIANAANDKAVSEALASTLQTLIDGDDSLKGNFKVTAAADGAITIEAIKTGDYSGSKGNMTVTASAAGNVTLQANTGAGGALAAAVSATQYMGTNTDATAANHSIDLSGVTDYTTLLDKGLTINGQQIEFYDADKGTYEGNAIGIDISDVTDEASLVNAIVTQAGGKLDGVTLSRDTGDDNLVVTSGEKGANSSVEVVDGGVNKDFKAEFQIGANQGQTMEINIKDMRSDALGIKDIDLSAKDGAKAAITTIQSAIESVSAQRSELGAFQNRLEHSIKNLDTSSENLQAAESRIRDVDMAKEMMELTKNNILQQAAQAMLAQANNAPQGVLQLLR